MITATSYSEVFEILKLMGKENVEKIPLNILEKIDNLRDKNYVAKINPEIPLEQQKVSRKALSILAWLNLEYLSTSKEKEVLMGIYKLNDKKDRQITNNFQVNIENVVSDNGNIEKISLVKYKTSFWSNLVNKIKQILKK